MHELIFGWDIGVSCLCIPVFLKEKKKYHVTFMNKKKKKKKIYHEKKYHMVNSFHFLNIQNHSLPFNVLYLGKIETF